MYQALLTRRYLTRRVMPMLAALAVLLCTAMVLVVWSVMGGFLNMLLASGRTLMGDALISWPLQGFAHYEELITDLEADPLVAAATPIVEAPGLLKTPDDNIHLVQAIGVHGPGYDRVTGYADAIWWKPISRPLPKDKNREDIRLDPRMSPLRLQQALALSTDPDPASGEPASVLGIELGRLNERHIGGWYIPRYLILGSDTVTLSVLPVSDRGVIIDAAARRFPVVNNFKTGLYEADAKTVIVPLRAMQEMTGMAGGTRVAPQAPAPGFGIRLNERGEEVFVTPEALGADPPRATTILIRAAEGVHPRAVRERAQAIYASFADRHKGEVPPAGPRGILIMTWDERPSVANFVAAVKKETALVLFLFAFISLTAVFLVFAIFWSMVSEKIKDVGILRAIGASRAGVAWLFVRYGLAIGVVGSLLGGALAVAVVWNINPIHEWLGHTLGIVVWDPRVYYFSAIPNQIDWPKAALVIAAGILFSVAGALAPALKAARMDPVKALRFE